MFTIILLYAYEAAMPNIEKERIIGIRVPVLRKYAKELAHGSRLFLSVQKEKRVCNTVKENDCDNVEKFLNTLPHYYYEENNLHMFLIMQMKDYDTALAYLEAFLPYIDNWATCDSGVPAVFKKHKNELILHVYEWLDSDKPYTVRYGNDECLTGLSFDFRTCRIPKDGYSRGGYRFRHSRGGIDSLFRGLHETYRRYT